MRNRYLIALILILSIHTLAASNLFPDTARVWKAGVARMDITPESPVWMGGYGFRNHPSEGILTPLSAKALAMEDASGNRAVLVTLDLVGMSKSMSDRIRDQLWKRYHLSRSQIILNASHTHSGPALPDNLTDIYPMDSIEKHKVDRYASELENRISELAGQALDSMVPVKIFAGNGVTRFQVNRRNNNEQKLSEQAELKGPNDYAVPVLKIVDGNGNLVAVAFGYACHGTVLNGYRFSADYMGFAQTELEKNHPGSVALFFQGAGGDQNPLPRRSLALAKQYGCELACSAERVLSEKMNPLEPVLKTAYSEIELKMNTPPGKKELQKDTLLLKDYEKQWAQRLLSEVRQGKTLPDSYPYPVEIWKLGDQLLIALGGELTVEYAIRLKKLVGSESFVLGYSNDVMAYIPTARILKEGGYEGKTSQRAYGLPSTWKPDIEKRIMLEVSKLAGQEGVTPGRENKK